MAFGWVLKALLDFNASNLSFCTKPICLTLMNSVPFFSPARHFLYILFMSSVWSVILFHFIAYDRLNSIRRAFQYTNQYTTPFTVNGSHIFVYTHSHTPVRVGCTCVLVILLDYTTIQTSPHNMFLIKIFFNNEKFAIFDRRSSACHWSKFVRNHMRQHFSSDDWFNSLAIIVGLISMVPSSTGNRALSEQHALIRWSFHWISSERCSFEKYHNSCSSSST